MKPDFHLNQQLELEFGDGIKKPINRRLILESTWNRRESHVSAKDAAAIVDFCNQIAELPDQELGVSVEAANNSTTSSTVRLEEGGESNSGHKHAAMSTFTTLLYLIKGNLGAGLFAIPAAFKDAGLVGGSIGIPLMALLSIHCMHMLVKCSSVMKERKGNPEMAMEYSEVLETACLTSSNKTISNWAKFARRFMKTALFIKELAFCSVFILFAATYLDQLIQFYAPNLNWDVHDWILCAIGPLALILGSIRNYNYLYPFSYVASLIKAASLVVLFYYIFREDLPHVSERPMFTTWREALLFYGTVIFAFEGVTQVLPLSDNMRTTRHFRGLTGVLNTGMLIISCLYFAVGFYGYLKYGSYTYPSITMNLPKSEIASQIVKIGLIISLMIAFSLQFFTAIEMTQPTVNHYISGKWKRLGAEGIIRLLTLSAAVACAYGAFNLDFYISLVGSFTCTFLCLLFPPLLDTLTFWEKMGKLRLAKNLFIILLAVLCFVLGTVAGVDYLIIYFQEEAGGGKCYPARC